jgi:hypothetical protein
VSSGQAQDIIWLKGGQQFRGEENLPCTHGRFSKKVLGGMIKIIANRLNKGVNSAQEV